MAAVSVASGRIETAFPVRVRARTGVARLLACVGLFLAPAFLLLGLGEALLWRTGESWPVDRVLRAQAAHPGALFMRGLLDQSLHAYKWQALLERRPQVLALGSSRVMKFRAEMFGAEAPLFYNAGGLVTSVSNLEAFAEQLPPHLTPRVILLGIDHWWLNDARPAGDVFLVHKDGAWRWQGHLLAFRSLVAHPGAAAPLFSALAPGGGAEDRFGLHARLRGEGLRYDGSLESGLPTPTTSAGWEFVDRDHPSTVKRIRRGVGFFEAAPAGASAARLETLRRGLVRLRSRGAIVVGFAPPICSKGVTMIETDRRHRRLWLEYHDRVKAVFSELGMPFVDASSPARLGLDDRYLIDGIHAEETFHAHILRRMLADPRVRRALPETLPTVEAALASPRTNFWRADLPPPRL